MESTRQQREWCVGRLGFVLPEEFILDGRTQSIYRVSVRTEALAGGKTGQELWDEKLLALKAAHQGPGSPEVRKDGTIPAASALWYGSDPTFPDERTLLVMKPLRGHAVFFQVEADAGNEAIAEQLVTSAVLAYIPGARYGFCVGEGAITSAVSSNERAFATFRDGKHPGLEVRISTHTVTQPRSEHPLSDVGAAQESLASQGVVLQVLRDEARTVAGLKGREGRISLTSASEGTMLRFTWFHPGEAARGDQPQILLEASAFDTHQVALEATWETLLRSMERLPRTR